MTDRERIENLQRENHELRVKLSAWMKAHDLLKNHNDELEKILREIK